MNKKAASPANKGASSYKNNSDSFLREQRIQRTCRAARTCLDHMRVDHCRADVTVTQQLLHGANVGA